MRAVYRFLARLLRREVLPARARGAALPVVLVVIAVMTTVVIQFVHDTRTNLHMAANVRDEVRAYYNAKAGMDIARLALGAQALIDTFAGNMNIQVWQYINQVMGVFAAARIDTPIASLDLSEVKGLGGITGAFDVEIVPEDGKLNLNSLAAGKSQRAAAILGLSVLMQQAEYRELFEQRDDKGNYNDPPEIIASLIDWVDSDDMLTNMQADGSYAQGGGAGESSRFGGFGIDIKPRNSKFDTIQEAHLIKGIGDDWWDAFGEALTVYPSAKINVNTAPPLLLAVVICAHLKNPQDPYCDPFNPGQLVAAVSGIDLYRRVMQSLFMTPFASKRIFTQFLQNGGRQGLMPEGLFFEAPPINFRKMQRNIEVKSPKVYTIHATGRVGTTEKTLTAVIDIARKGRLYYWREF